MTIETRGTSGAEGSDAQVDALQLDARDNVATLLHAIEAGQICAVATPGGLRHLVAIDPIAMHHKIALEPIARGAPLRKYGEVIGEARIDIASGAHVHIHNLVSLRAR